MWDNSVPSYGLFLDMNGKMKTLFGCLKCQLCSWVCLSALPFLPQRSSKYAEQAVGITASSVAREGWRCAGGCISPSSSMCGLCLGQPSASPIDPLPPSSRSTSYTVIRVVTPFLDVFKLLLLLRAKPLSQLLLGFWLTWRQCEGWVVLPQCPAPVPLGREPICLWAIC